VKTFVLKMKNKTTGHDGIPSEAWQMLAIKGKGYKF
jgi:hypothetical protein